jgi:hypothetical protein
VRPATGGLVAGASLAFVVWGLGALLSVAFGWPAQFGGRGDPDNVAGELVVRGTVTAPPVYLMVVLAGLALLAPSRKWWGTLAGVGLCLLAALTFVGSLGEALAPPTPDVPGGVLLASGVVGVLLADALFHGRQGAGGQAAVGG